MVTVTIDPDSTRAVSYTHLRNGKLQQKAMKQLRFTVEDLMEGLRLKDVFDLSSVEFAAVETNGQLSVLLKPEQSPPTAQDLNVAVKNRGISVVVISNGKICSDSLELCGKTEKWVLKQVESEKLDLEDVFLMTADKSSGYYPVSYTHLSITSASIPFRRRTPSSVLGSVFKFSKYHVPGAAGIRLP